MKKRLLTLFIGIFFLFTQAVAQQKTVTGKVNDEDGLPLPGVSVKIKGTTTGVSTGTNGNYSIRVSSGQTLVYSFIGTLPKEHTVGDDNSINIILRSDSKALNEVIVTALGIPKEKKALGYAATEVKGADLANTQRDNFLNALQGRVAGVSVTGTSGMPGSSTSIIIRGINSISSSNQPLFVVDGLPIDNKTLNTTSFAVDRFANRNLDFSNRASDINPEDIESITILKGPEAAALYGLDAANGAVLITTKKGKAGVGTIDYSNNFAVENVYRFPEVQTKYANGTGGVSNSNTFTRFGPEYAQGTQLYDNISTFFQNGLAQKHNLAMSGGSDKITYRFSTSYASREGVVKNTRYDRLNLGLYGTAKLKDNIKSETNLQYVNTYNIKASRGQNSFLLGLVAWPLNDNMSDYLTPAGARRRVTSGFEIENPYFDINKNKLNDRGNRFIGNQAFFIDAAPWLSFTGRVGFDVSSTEYSISYHPSSNRAIGTTPGTFDRLTDNTRNLTVQYFGTAKKSFFNDKLKTTYRLGQAIYDYTSRINSAHGEKYIDPDFVSISNTDPLTQRAAQRFTQKRLIGVFGGADFDYDNFLYLALTGRNDWTSTLADGNNSFFYPSASLSFVFTDFKPLKNAFGNVLSFGKLRSSIAQVGKDTRPYSLYPALESQVTTGGGYSFGFTAPNPGLKPEKVTSYEFGTELKFFKDRLGIDAAYYKSRSVNQIITGLRLSYGGGFILRNINAGELTNDGIELQLNGTPIQTDNFNWTTTLNWTKTRSNLIRLSDQTTEFYDSDTWLYLNVRNGSKPGGPLTTFTGNSYERNKDGEILVSPTSGLPLTQNLFNVVGDRNPDFMMGITNSFKYKSLNLSFLLDIRKGGDVYNATGLYMYSGGFSKLTEDRETPRVFNGVLKDGMQDTATPTRNNIEVIPYYNNNYYTSIANEQFIERDVNWLRLRDVSVSYGLPKSLIGRAKVLRSASVFLTATDLLMFTNYSGGDPGVNGTTASSGGSGGSGFDYGNLPVPRVFNFGFKVGL